MHSGNRTKPQIPLLFFMLRQKGKLWLGWLFYEFDEALYCALCRRNLFYLLCSSFDKTACKSTRMGGTVVSAIGQSKSWVSIRRTAEAFACSPGARVGFLWVLWLPQSEDVHIVIAAEYKLAAGVNGCQSCWWQTGYPVTAGTGSSRATALN